MTDRPDRPAPGSHDRRVPSGSLEESAAAIYEAALEARAAEERGTSHSGALHAFYRAVMGGTLLLPVPPDHGEEARRALEAAVHEDQEVEISVMLAREPDGGSVSVVFGSFAALSAWSPSGTGNLPLPARIAIRNLAATGLPAILDPAGPVPYRFAPDELATLAAGRLPGSDEPLTAPSRRGSIRVRLPRTDTRDLERSLAAALAPTRVEAAYLAETEDEGGRPHLLLGLVGDEGASATVDVPDGTEVAWLEEPLLGQVRALVEPFHRRPR